MYLEISLQQGIDWILHGVNLIIRRALSRHHDSRLVLDASCLQVLYLAESCAIANKRPAGWPGVFYAPSVNTIHITPPAPLHSVSQFTPVAHHLPIQYSIAILRHLVAQKQVLWHIHKDARSLEGCEHRPFCRCQFAISGATQAPKGLVQGTSGSNDPIGESDGFKTNNDSRPVCG